MDWRHTHTHTQSGSRETRWRIAEALGMSDDGALDWKREMERTEYDVEVESIKFASLH